MEKTSITNEQSKKLKYLEVKINNFKKQKPKKNKELTAINDLEEEEIIDNKKSDYDKTPEFLKSKKLIINPLTKDSNSF